MFKINVPFYISYVFIQNNNQCSSLAPNFVFFLSPNPLHSPLEYRKRFTIRKIIVIFNVFFILVYAVYIFERHPLCSFTQFRRFGRHSKLQTPNNRFLAPNVRIKFVIFFEPFGNRFCSSGMIHCLNKFFLHYTSIILKTYVNLLT